MMFYRTVIQVEVLSRGPLPNGMSLESMAYEIVEGGCSGQITTTIEEEVDGPKMAQLLIDQGSGPEFLGLTDDGQEA